MTIRFEIPQADKVIHKNSFVVWLSIFLTGRVKLGTFYGQEWFAFMCKNHGLQVDNLHGYIDGHYYHSCNMKGCEYKQIL